MGQHQTGKRIRGRSGFFLGLLCVASMGVAKSGRAAEPIVPADAKLEKLFEGQVLTEGVAVAPDGLVYFSDITFSHVAVGPQGEIQAGHIWRYDPGTGKTVIFRSPSGMSNGIKFDAAGNMLVCEGADYGGRRVTRTDMKTGMSWIIAGMYEGRPLNSPNDLTIDDRGRIYFSDPRYLGHEPLDQPLQAVYRLDPGRPSWAELSLTPGKLRMGSAFRPIRKLCTWSATTTARRRSIG